MLHPISRSLDTGSTLAYVEKTSNTSVTATTEGTADTVVTATAITFDGATVAMIEFYAPLVDNPAGGASRSQTLVLYEDGASIGQIGQVLNTATAVNQTPVHVVRRRTPAAGSRTYSIRAYVSAGTGTVYGGAGGSGAIMPAFILVVKA